MLPLLVMLPNFQTHEEAHRLDNSSTGHISVILVFGLSILAFKDPLSPGIRLLNMSSLNN